MKKVTIVMYHYVRPIEGSRYPGIKGLEYELFKQQIAYFHEKYQVVRVEEVIAALEENYELPENAMLLTFDDGYIDHYQYAFPVLDSYKMQGSFYIPAKTFVENKLLDVNKVHFVLASASVDKLVAELFKKMDHYRGQEFDYADNETLFAEYAVPNRFDDKETIFVKRMLQTVLPEELRNRIASDLFAEFVGMSEEAFAKELYMNREQLSCMKRNGMFIGLHGYDHYWLGNLPETQMQQDVDKALEAMADFIDPAAWVMNYPYGSHNDAVDAYVAKRGCKLGFSTEVRVADLTKDNPVGLPRLDTNDFWPKKR